MVLSTIQLFPRGGMGQCCRRVSLSAYHIFVPSLFMLNRLLCRDREGLIPPSFFLSLILSRSLSLSLPLPLSLSLSLSCSSHVPPLSRQTPTLRTNVDIRSDIYMLAFVVGLLSSYLSIYLHIDPSIYLLSICICACTYVCVCIYIHIHIYIYTHTSLHTYVRTYAPHAVVTVEYLGLLETGVFAVPE